MLRSLLVSGVLPSSLAENSGPRDWIATLSLFGDLDGLIGVELLGPDALAFSATLLPGLDALRITPGAPVDYEALLAAGRVPSIDFSLRFTFADGSVVEDPTPRSVTVLDRDDTPPTGLAFASGGTVLAGAIGAAIGALTVTDPDTAGPFTFFFPEEDAWRFEVVGSVLKLRDGISLGLDDMPRRPLIIEVWDGHQSAAFSLEIRVADPATRLADLPPGETRGGFGMIDADTALALRESRAVAQVEHLGDGGQVVTLQDGTEVTLPVVGRVRFVDGFQDIGPQSAGVQAAALFQALTGHAADGRALAELVARADAGTAWTEIAATAPGLATLPAADADAVASLYHNAFGRDASDAELALQTGRLAAGVSRAQLAVDLALSAEALAHQPEGGVWIADPLGDGASWRSDPGGLAAAAAPAPVATDPLWLV